MSLYALNLFDLADNDDYLAYSQRSVAAVGSSWSFSDIALTAGYLVETTGLNRILSSVLPRALIPNATSIVPIPGSTPAPKQFIHVEAGIILENLMTLARRLRP